MKISLLQCNPKAGAIAANVAYIEEKARSARLVGASFCVASAGAVCGYPLHGLIEQEGLGAIVERELGELAARMANGPDIFVNGLPGMPHGRPMEGQGLFLLQGGKLSKFGTQSGLAQCGTVRFGCALSYGSASGALAELESLAAGGADVLLHLSAYPYEFNGQKRLHEQLSRVARSTGKTLLHVNQAGCMDGVLFGGQSQAFSPDGSLFGRAALFVPDSLIVDVAQQSGHVLPVPQSREEAWWQALVAGCRDFAAKNGMHKAVIGLSGGMDSALVAAIAAEALGAERVHGLIMPSPHNGADSVADALALAHNLGISTEIIPIAPLMQAYEFTLAKSFTGTEPDVTEENLQARIRGNLLMAYANKFGSMLLNTGNKSELAVGYCTLYGDMCGALALIGDLYKTEVYRLARWKNTHEGREIIPDAVFHKAPSAELRPGQCDQDSLPPYEVLDRILQYLIEGRALPEAIPGDPQIVKEVVRLVARSEFKRKQAPPVVSLSLRPFGISWSMPQVFTLPR